MFKQYQLQLRPSIIFGVFAMLCALISSFLFSSDAFAGREVNARLHYGNIGSFCASGSNRALGMIWISNASDYYSESVIVSGNATSASVQLRGALNTCGTQLRDSDVNQVWAADVRVAAGPISISGSEFWRGNVPRWSTNAWSSGHDAANGNGSHLDGTLNISGVAQCTSANAGTVVSGQVLVGIYRYLQWRQIVNGQWMVYRAGDGTEWINIQVQRSCPHNFQLNPTISATPTVADPGANVRVSPSVGNTGSTISSNARYEVRTFNVAPGAAIPGGGQSGNAPSVQYPTSTAVNPAVTGTRTFPTGSTPFSVINQTLGDLAVGTRVCYVLSVQPYRHDNGNWMHSTPSCVTISKAPKAQVIGGDLLVGRSVMGTSPSVSGRVITSQSINARGTFGSWGEYAIIPSGPVTAMSSGSGTVNGNQTNLNLLTFANQGVATASCGTSLGCYTQGGSLPNIGSRFRTSASTPAITSGSLTSRSGGVYRGSGSIRIDASTIQAGKWIVINAPTATVTIAGDINYGSAPINSSSQIPQLIIIANNITIQAGVRNVDAWLVAPGTYSGNTVTGGVIRTCDAAPAAISAGTCSEPLTVNGPVVAYRLLMLRTGGAGPQDQAGEPAERFNFRPDAYIWALNQGEASGRVTTVSAKELPPRY